MNLRRLLLVSCVLAFGFSPVLADTVVYKGAVVHIGDGRTLENGVVVVEGDKILAVGTDIAIPNDAEVFDVAGSHLTPGFIDANSWAGLVNPNTWTEHVSEVVPQMSVHDIVDVHSRDFESLAEGGVTTVYVAPGSGAVIGTQGAVFKTRTAGGQARSLDAHSAIQAAMGSEPASKGTFNGQPSRTRGASFLSRRPTTRMGTVAVFRKAFYDAMAFAETGQGLDDQHHPDALKEIGRVLSGDAPLRILARAASDIESAVKMSKEFGFKFTLVEPYQAFTILDFLEKHKMPVVCGPLYRQPPRGSGGGFFRTRGERTDYELWALTTPALLSDRGFEVALSAREFLGEDGLRGQAIFARRYGMSEGEALKAVTSAPAKILGMADRLGTLEAGKHADLVIWSGPPLDPISRALLVAIDGKVVAGKAKGSGS